MHVHWYFLFSKLASFNIFFTCNTESWTNASTEALSLIYNLIWKPKSNTANTSSSIRIKWSKKNTLNSNNTKKTKETNSNISHSSNSSSKSEKIKLLPLICESYIQNNYNYSQCISNLINSISTHILSTLSR